MVYCLVSSYKSPVKLNMPPKRSPSAVKAVEATDETAQPVTKKSRAEPAAAPKTGRKAAPKKSAASAVADDDESVATNLKSGAASAKAEVDSSTTTTSKSGAAAPAAAAADKKKAEEDETPLGPGHPGNKPLITAFLQLAVYEYKFGDPFAALGCLKVHEKLRRHVPEKIDPTTASKKLPEECHIGRGAKIQIDQFYGITTSPNVPVVAGQINRLEELRAENGTAVPELDGNHNDALEKLIAEIKATAVEGKPLSAEVLKKIEAAKAQFLPLKIPGLKDILRTNQQILTGVKDDLIERCAQGAVLGAVPRCPHCHGGKLRFDKEKGLYWCHGYMDDDEYKTCYFNTNTVQFDPWM